MQDKYIRISYKLGEKTVHRYFAALTVGCDKINKQFDGNPINYTAIRVKKFPFKHNGFHFAKIKIERKPKKK